MAKKSVNIRDIAKEAGVSVASVSRAFQKEPSPYLSEKQRARILDICAQMRYSPNEHSRRMFAKRANTIAFFFQPFTRSTEPLAGGIDANFGACLMGAQQTLSVHGIDLLLCETSELFVAERRYIKMIRGQSIDGILFWGALESDHFITEVLAENTPCVMLQTEKTGSTCPCVLSDDYAAMTALTERVIAAGHRRIGVMPAPGNSTTSNARRKGIVDTLAKHKLPPAYVAATSGYDYHCGRCAAKEILDHVADVTCIMNSNDMAAWGCIDELRARGFDVPDDISVTGADGLMVPNALRVSSFTLPSHEIGCQGAELLHGLINGRNPDTRITLMPAPVEGNTLIALRHT